MGFFDEHHVFSANEIRRMRDVNFALVFTITIMSTYFNRDDEVETYLDTFNDDFPDAGELELQIKKVFAFVDSCQFDPNCRVWKLSDLLSLLVELHRVLVRDGIDLDPQVISKRLGSFYGEVDQFVKNPLSLPESYKASTVEYARLASQATNDRGTRIRRGEIIREILVGGVTQPVLFQNQS